MIDPDYCGEIKTLLINNSSDEIKIKKDDHIAQAILKKASVPVIEEVKKLGNTERREKGFGSMNNVQNMNSDILVFNRSINKHFTKVLIDSGSSENFICEDFMTKSKIPIPKSISFSSNQRPVVSVDHQAQSIGVQPLLFVLLDGRHGGVVVERDIGKASQTLGDRWGNHARDTHFRLSADHIERPDGEHLLQDFVWVLKIERQGTGLADIQRQQFGETVNQRHLHFGDAEAEILVVEHFERA